MSHRVILNSDHARSLAYSLVAKAPDGFVMTLSERKRTNEQNDFMWGLLTDISVAKPLGRRHTPEDWKAIAMNACGWECQFIEGLDGRPFPQGFRSSRLTKTQMSNLIEWLLAFGAEQGVRWTHETKDAA